MMKSGIPVDGGPRTPASLIVGAPIAPQAPVRGSFAGRSLRLLFRPEPAGLGHRNRISNFGFYFLAAAGGSGASVAAALLGSWALLSMLLGRFRFRLERSDRPIVVTTLLFFAVMATSELLHADNSTAWLDVAALLPFIIPFFLISRMRQSSFPDTLPPAFLGAAVGGLVLLPIVLFEYQFVSLRVQAFAGNSGPLSVTSLLCAGWALLGVSRTQSRTHLLLILLGVLGASLAVILSGMRGAWPLLPIVLGIAVFARRREYAALWRQGSVIARLGVIAMFAVILACIALVALPLILTRLDQMWSDLGLIAANSDTPTSLNLRKEMYGAALKAIEAEPLIGYGSENHWRAVTPYLNRETFDGRTFSHFHNVFLTVGVDAGLIGIAALIAMISAPIMVAWRARKALGGSRRLAAALILVVSFVGAGMTNIMLFHDILDAVWVFSLALIAASVPAPVLLATVANARDRKLR